MSNWIYELQRRRSRDYTLTAPSQGYDRPGNRRHTQTVHSEMLPHATRQHQFRQRYNDEHPIQSRTRIQDDTAGRNPLIPDFSGKLSHQRMPDDIMTNNRIDRKSFGKRNARPELSTDNQQRLVDSDELSYAECRYRGDR